MLSEDVRVNSLRELVREYFEKKYPVTCNPEGIALCGESGQKWTFDLVINADEGRFGIFVRDWGRSIGVNQLRRLEKACRDTAMAGGIIFGNIFSPHAKKFGKGYGIQVITRGELVQKMGVWR
ncbi:MAG: hypothetical protein RBG13Loki_2464 [Promethearchaeota archaeon CR_4]|nr:MAG: hypothetical protein RBG13Loki_2464 [Candidatus Lokiarchaeota archaeon CR_4]